MKKILKNRAFFLLTFLLVSGTVNFLHAQSGYDSAYIGMASSSRENLVVFTDRSIYAVNENILFSALLQSDGKTYHGLGSGVLYVDLVNAVGRTVAMSKYQIVENQSRGYLAIPSSIYTGNYYFRCYTRWMRNFGPRDFTYIPLYIVNPYGTEVEPSIVESVKNRLGAVPNGPSKVTLSISGNSFNMGENIDVQQTLSKGNSSPVEFGCLTVVPAGTIDTASYLYKVESNEGLPASFHFNFLPETDRIALSGTVIDQTGQKTAPDIRIHFSILGEHPAYIVTESDENGRFLIKTPLRMADQEMFVYPESPSGSSYQVLIDNDFATDPLPFQPVSFAIQYDELKIASRVSLNMQLQQYFTEPSGNESSKTTNLTEPIPFFGKPEISVKLDNFVNLPNLEEVVENLIPKTFIVHHRGKPSFLIKGENPLISFFPPLVLVDHIPIFDMEAIMSIPPSKVDLIEVVPEVYILGEVKYGGIISITSLQGDFAGIKLPEGSYFFEYSTFQFSRSPLQSRNLGPGKVPDTRNTLFWSDQLELQAGETRKVSFSAPSTPGPYLILFRGVSSDGTIVHGLNHFQVE